MAHNSFSTKRYSPEQKAEAERNNAVLFMWEMDKRFVLDPAHKGSKISICGPMTLDKAKRIWAIIKEPNNFR